MKKLKLTNDEQYYAERTLNEMKPGTCITIAYDKDYTIRIYKTTGY